MYDDDGKCRSCEHWDQSDEEEGTCHAEAPKPTAFAVPLLDVHSYSNRIGVVVWPTTLGKDRCGKWTPKDR
jgi:hypothetical protein